MKKLSILGSTGSIGTQTLEVARNNASEFKIAGLSANTNIELLKKQISEFNPEAVAVMDKEKADLLKKQVDISVYSGIEGIVKIAKLSEADTVVNSLVGAIGVMPTIEAIKAKKDIALANKETLVVAGDIVMKEVKKAKINLMPIDSEHSAIFQCLNGESKKEVSKIIITASGGPFRTKSIEEMQKMTVNDALNHPTWSMGNKITIDSATLMNKGLEVIEAHFLYGVGYENIEVVVHPQSIVHSLVEFKDKSVMAQLGNPSMKLPIQYALSYPKRLNLEMKKLNLAEIKNLTFEEPDLERFSCLKYAYEAGKISGSMPCVMNAANEIAVPAFLDGKIGFLDIPKIIRKTMDNHNTIKKPDINRILDADKKTRGETQKIIGTEDF